ncbi:CPBP family intramembrane glutamic endopeptidase [Halorussus caseinilyticus]|uniref:CPBP family intramembrane glutamic endopeptidase n=1 Tax=Halorussus caseinilyticus TaxID=3034025 RepID=A0ABD5WKV1_9EURY|nr:CPBP family intramembrane glutamic endopeptidase [Halorussus sp. DT72]
MRETTLRLLAVASIPLFATVFFGIVGLLARHTSRFTYRNRHSRLVYAVFVSGFAAAFLAASGQTLSLEFDPWYALFALLGGALYGLDTAAWAAWTGQSIRRGDQRLAWLLPALVVPLPEELVYRAGLAPLRETVGPVGFVVASAVLFGVSHVTRGKKEIAFKTGNGVVYALVFLATGSVVAPVLAHFGYNVAYVWYVADLPTIRELTAKSQ